MFQVRTEFYGFVPIFPIKKNSFNKAYYGKVFSRFEYLGELSVVCHLPFGAISAYVNHYSSPRKEWNVGITLGWQLFNYRFIEWFFSKKIGELFANSKICCIFAPVKQRGRVAQLNRVADYGSAGYRFESCRDHREPLQEICRGFLFIPTDPHLCVIFFLVS